MHEFLWVKFKVELDDAAMYAQSHTVPWYRFKCLKFQFGDTLIVLPSGAVVYNVIDISKQIIKVCSVKEKKITGTNKGFLQIKVAKENASGELEPLNTAELTDFEGYVDGFKDAGVFTQIITQNADVLKLYANVYYKSSVVPFSVFQIEFEKAVNTYLRNIDFDGTFRKIKMIDAMQDVLGFVDIDIQVIEGSTSYLTSPSYQPIGLSYESVSGFLKIDSLFPFVTTINYIQYV
jgi:hypothetical protein